MSSRLSQIGIQQWRLKQSFRSSGIISPEPEIEQNSTAQQASSELVSNPLENTEVEHQAPPANELESGFGEDSRHDELNDDNLSNYGWSQLENLLTSESFCSSCHLSQSVLGEGNTDADWFFLIDSPSRRDIEHQRLLTGRVGELYEAILKAIKLSRESVYLASIFKCAPNDDMSLAPQCDAIVRQQIALVQPDVVVTLGEFASQSLIRSNDGLTQLRANNQKCHNENIPIIPTYSLSEMLDKPQLKAHVWTDLKRAIALTK